MKRVILLSMIVAVAAVLAGCTLFNGIDEGTLTLSVPESGYPPFEATIKAGGAIGGQYTFEIEGKTYTQTSDTLIVTIDALPCEVTVSWLGTGDMQTVTKTIWLQNTGPVPGRLVLNFITNLWTLHAKQRYIVTYPSAYDPEGGPVRLISAVVEWGNYGRLAVFCPPYTGIPPWDGVVDEYHVRLDTGLMVYNAFMFMQGWPEHIDDGGPSSTNLPYSPPDWAVDGYPGGGTGCLTWPTDTRPGTDVTVTTLWEDEQKATTLDVQTIPANPYIGCGPVQTASAVCL